MIDSEGNAWVADNFTVGAQNQDASWTGGLTKFAPNGKPLSPSPWASGAEASQAPVSA